MCTKYSQNKDRDLYHGQKIQNDSVPTQRVHSHFTRCSSLLAPLQPLELSSFPLRQLVPTAWNIHLPQGTSFTLEGNGSLIQGSLPLISLLRPNYLFCGPLCLISTLFTVTTHMSLKADLNNILCFQIKF